MPGVFAVTRSHSLSKVLALNSTAPVFDFQQIPRQREPGTGTDPLGVTQGVLETDVKKWGKDGMESPRLVFLQPYIEAQEGTPFYLNVWGYSDAGSENPPQQVLWVPFFIVQLYCIAGNIPGVSPNSYLNENENLCGTIAATLGSLGSGYISSPGGNYAAFAAVDVVGARRFEVEFAADPGSPVTPLSSVPGMNALWRPL